MSHVTANNLKKEHVPYSIYCTTEASKRLLYSFTRLSHQATRHLLASSRCYVTFTIFLNKLLYIYTLPQQASWHLHSSSPNYVKFTLSASSSILPLFSHIQAKKSHFFSYREITTNKELNRTHRQIKIICKNTKIKYFVFFIFKKSFSPLSLLWVESNQQQILQLFCSLISVDFILTNHFVNLQSF